MRRTFTNVVSSIAQYAGELVAIADRAIGEILTDNDPVKVAAMMVAHPRGRVYPSYALQNTNIRLVGRVTDSLQDLPGGQKLTRKCFLGTVEGNVVTSSLTVVMERVTLGNAIFYHLEVSGPDKLANEFLSLIGLETQSKQGTRLLDKF